MDDGDKSDPGNEFTSDDSSWPLGPDSESVYFFSNDRESSILSEFGWNLHPEDPNRIGFDDASDLAGSFGLPDNNTSNSPLQGSDPAAPVGSDSKVGDASTSNNPSMSSSPSEDLPERSTGSGGKPPEIP